MLALPCKGISRIFFCRGEGGGGGQLSKIKQYRFWGVVWSYFVYVLSYSCFFIYNSGAFYEIFFWFGSFFLMFPKCTFSICFQVDLALYKSHILLSLFVKGIEQYLSVCDNYPPPPPPDFPSLLPCFFNYIASWRLEYFWTDGWWRLLWFIGILE